MTLKYLFDASSLVRALKETRLIPLGGQAVHWLTIYEFLNVLWKEVHLLHKLSSEEASSLVTDFTEILREMVILEPRGLEEITLWIAISKGITAYDASYIAIAKNYNLTLVTEDRKLLRAASSIINAVNLDDI